MTNITNTTNPSNKEKRFDIHDRIYAFIIRVIKLTNSLPKTPSNIVVIAQLLRCATSMGANDQEADGTLTRKDFIHKFATVRKEGKETNFWLQLISDTNPQSIRKEALSILSEGREITAIVSSIVNKTRR